MAKILEQDLNLKKNHNFFTFLFQNIVSYSKEYIPCKYPQATNINAVQIQTTKPTSPTIVRVKCPSSALLSRRLRLKHSAFNYGAGVCDLVALFAAHANQSHHHHLSLYQD